MFHIVLYCCTILDVFRGTKLNKILVGFKEDPEIIKKIDDQAGKRGLQRSDLIREAIREYIDRHQFSGSL